MYIKCFCTLDLECGITDSMAVMQLAVQTVLVLTQVLASHIMSVSMWFVGVM